MELSMTSGHNYIRNSIDDFRDEISERLNVLQHAINGRASKDELEFMHSRLYSLERFFALNAVVEMLENHKFNWIADSKGGEPNHYQNKRRK
mgnify:CR=1 FL=1